MPRGRQCVQIQERCGAEEYRNDTNMPRGRQCVQIQERCGAEEYRNDTNKQTNKQTKERQCPRSNLPVVFAAELTRYKLVIC